MGIINVTPDSFSDGGLCLDPDRAAEWARQLVAQGADLLDLGAESTRPGSRPVDAATEQARLLPALTAVRKVVDVPLSVDTYKAEVAAAALRAGADRSEEHTSELQSRENLVCRLLLEKKNAQNLISNGE